LGNQRKEFGEAEGPQGRASGRERIHHAEFCLFCPKPSPFPANPVHPVQTAFARQNPPIPNRVESGCELDILDPLVPDGLNFFQGLNESQIEG
jgi:hypothetical protein